MRTMAVLACCLLGLTAHFAAVAEPLEGLPLSRVFGHTPVTAMTGNGRLTASLDATGRLVGLRWPSPGYFEHALVPQGLEDDTRSLEWGIDDGTAVHWADAPHSDTLQHYREDESVAVLTAHTAGPYSLQQTAVTHPTQDILLIHVRMTGETPPQGVVVRWRASPSTRILPRAPLPWEDTGAVASVQDAGRMYTIKPYSLPRADAMPSAQSVIDGGGQDEVPAIWLALGAYPEPVAVMLTTRGESDAASEKTVSGPADGTLRIQPEPIDGGWEFWLALSAARSQTVCDRNIQVGLTRRQSLVEEASAWWSSRLARANLPASTDTAARTLAQRALITILLLQDGASGAIVRAPVSRPPLALDRPADSVWAAIALATAGYHVEARRHMEFLASAVRDGRGRLPDGAFASAYYSSGIEAAPESIREVDHGAWFIWGCLVVANTLPEADAEAFLEAQWEAIARAASFVHGWWDPIRRRPLASFDPQRMRDRARPEQLLTTYMAMDSALAIAGRLGYTRENWTIRRAELRSLIDYHLVTADPSWRVPDAALYWPASPFPFTHPIWNETAVRYARGEDPPRGEPAARAAHFLSRLTAARRAPRGGPWVEELSHAVAQSMFIPDSAGMDFWPDAVSAAHAYLAVMQASSRPPRVIPPSTAP